MIRGRLRGFIVFILFSSHICAQQFGGLLPAIKWKQVNNDTARVIFPEAMYSQAREVASIINALSHQTLPTIGTKVRKINIVFQNQSTISNGYVQLAPYRSEFQLTADQNSFELGSLPWPKQLVIHEYRHVQQYNNYRVGLSKALYYLFGESGQELANSISIPNWFWEGDAVFQETLVSRQGRGRIPFFFNGYRSIWAAEKKYSWMKLRNGSLRDFIPDHYPLGYMLVAYGREKFGDEIWKPVTGNAAAFKGLFYPMQKGVQRNMGISFPKYRADALNFFKAQLPSGSPANSLDSFAAHQRHFAGDQEYPQFLDEKRIIFVESSYKKVHRFVIRDFSSGKDKTIRIRSISLDNYFSCRNEQIAYAAYETNLRWGWSDFSVLRILDIKTGKERRISSRSKYFSPDISPDGKQIAAVEQDPDGGISLVILNAGDGSLKKKLPNPNQYYFTYPKFLNAQDLVTPLRNPKGEMALALVHIDDGSVSFLTPFSMNLICYPSIHKDSVFFSASLDGRDQLFVLAGKVLYRVSLPGMDESSRNYQFQAYADHCVWTRFTAVGYRMSILPASAIEWIPIQASVLATPLTDMDIHALQRGPVDLADRVRPTEAAAGSYPETSHLFNIYSWRPYITDPNYTFALESQNVMNTLQSELYFTYNRNEESKKIGLNALYGAFFPWIDLGFSYTFDRNGIYKNKEIFWNEWQARAGLSVPLYLSQGKTYAQWLAGIDFVLDQPQLNAKSASFKDSLNLDGFLYINPKINFTNQSQKAKQQINPSWAQTVLLEYDQALTQYNAQQFLISGYFYFPGLAATNSLVLTAAFQERDSLNQVRYSNDFPFSRGYTAENFYRMVRLGANYHVPLAYPDWGFANMIYFLRIRSNIFFDYTRALNNFVNGPPVWNDYRSIGAELFFDTKWWNQLPISFGIRYSRLLDPDFLGRSPNQWEFVLPLNLLSK